MTWCSGFASRIRAHAARWEGLRRLPVRTEHVNTAGYNMMADPLFDGKAAVMFYCGDDVGAKETVR